MYIEVKGDSANDLERALRQFTRMVKKSEIMNELKKREFYVKRSRKKILKQEEAFRRRISDARKLEKRKKSDW